MTPVYPQNSVVVLDIAGKDARIFCSDAGKEPFLVGLGFSKDMELFHRPIKDDADRKQLVISLALQGSLFSRGKGWLPAELVAFYKEQGLPIGECRVIAWRSPANYGVTTER